MAVSDAELAQRLREVGEGISDISSSPGSSEEIIKRLQIAENLLAHVEQGPPNFVLEALIPSTRALISEHLVRHSEIDVKVTVAACITEVLRISAPDTPFTDEQMKDIFRLTIVAFDCLSPPEGFRYNKAKSILCIVSKIRLCVILLDLECNALIAEIFKHFFRHVGPNHPETVVSSMEKIMEMVIDECEVLPSGVLGVLLSSVRKDTQRISPVASKLGEKIITKYASFLESYVVDSVENNDILLDDYNDIVTSIHQKGIEKIEEKNNCDEVVTKNSGLRRGFLVKYFDKSRKESLSADDEEKDDSETEKELNEIMPMPERCTVKPRETKIKRVDDSSKEEKTDPENKVSKPDSALTLKKKAKNVYSRKKGGSDRSGETNDDLASDDDEDNLKRKRSALSEEDDDSDLNDAKTPKSTVIRLKTKIEEKKRGRLTKSGLSSKSKKATPKAKSTVKSEAAKRRKRRNSDLKVKGSTSQKKKGSESIFKRARVIGKEEDPESPELGESLVGRSIMVWWPLDKMFYEGVVVSYDDVGKKHKIDYIDGDVEILNLKKEIYHLMEPGQTDLDMLDISSPTDLDLLDISSPTSPQAGKEDVADSSSESLLKGKLVSSSVKGKRVPKLNQEKEAKADISSKSNRGKGFLKMKNVRRKQVKKSVGKKQAKPVASSKRNRKKEDEETESDEGEPAKTVLSPKSSSEKEKHDASMEDGDMIISDGSLGDTAKTDPKGKAVASENPDTEFGAEECAGKLVEMKNGEKSNRWGFVYSSRKKKGGAKK